MKRYKIPNTDLDISRIGFGCGSLSIFWDDQPVGPDELATAPKIMRMVSEMGVNFFDIAASYAYGKCEVALGHVLNEMPSLRDEIIIQSKCGILLPKSMELVNLLRMIPTISMLSGNIFWLRLKEASSVWALIISTYC